MDWITTSKYKRLPEQAKNRLRKFVSQLPDHKRQIFDLFDSGQTFEQIGTVLGERPAKIRNILQSALRQLSWEAESESKLAEVKDNREISIESLRLSVRAYNIISDAEIRNVGQLLDYPPHRLLERNNCGKVILREILDVLITLGYDCETKQIEKLQKLYLSLDESERRAFHSWLNSREHREDV
jgi:hypothetical protein